MDHDSEYDLILRDPEGGILQRWIIDSEGRPCLGNGEICKPIEVYDEIEQLVLQDIEQRKE